MGQTENMTDLVVGLVIGGELMTQLLVTTAKSSANVAKSAITEFRMVYVEMLCFFVLCYVTVVHNKIFVLLHIS